MRKTKIGRLNKEELIVQQGYGDLNELHSKVAWKVDLARSNKNYGYRLITIREYGPRSVLMEQNNASTEKK